MVTSTQDTQSHPSGQATAAASDRSTMRAIVFDAYGPLDGLQVRDIPRPRVGRDDVLVCVQTAALHVGDLFTVHGSPWLTRLATGLLKPTYGVPGFDVAGRVEEVGADVTRFRPGDEVFGACNGACAEYASAKANQLAHKPSNVSFEQAVGLTMSGLAALHGLRDAAKLRAGQKLLINGAAGGIGSFAVQLAKLSGAEVTGVCSTANVDFVRELGADHVVDYTREDFTQHLQRYDVILDNVENRTLAECRRALTADGTLVCNSGTGASGLRFFVRLLAPVVLSPFARQNLRRYLSMPNAEDLAHLAQLVESGKLTPAIGRVMPLQDTAAALAHIASGHARGKTVIAVA